MSNLAALYARLCELKAELSKYRERLDAIQSEEVDAVVVRARGSYTFETVDHPYHFLIEHITSPVITSMRRTRTGSRPGKVERRHKPISPLFDLEECLYAGSAEGWDQNTAYTQGVALYTKELHHKIAPTIPLIVVGGGLSTASG